MTPFFLPVAEGAIVTWQMEETVAVGFGTIYVMPVWRFLLEILRMGGTE